MKHSILASLFLTLLLGVSANPIPDAAPQPDLFGNGNFRERDAAATEPASNETAESNNSIYKTNLDKSAHLIKWGYHIPADTIRNSLSSHCYDSSCNNIDFSLPTAWFANGVEVSGHLHFKMSGVYPSGKKGYFVNALAAMAHRLHKQYEHDVTTCTGGGDTGTSCTTKKVQFYTSGKYFSASRFKKSDGSDAGFMSATIDVTADDGSQICSEITSALGSLMAAGGEIAAIGGGFFGAFGQGFCSG